VQVTLFEAEVGHGREVVLPGLTPPAAPLMRPDARALVQVLVLLLFFYLGPFPFPFPFPFIFVNSAIVGVMMVMVMGNGL
jgi:hypothetical protein